MAGVFILEWGEEREASHDGHDEEQEGDSRIGHKPIHVELVVPKTFHRMSYQNGTNEE
jgi:hypothetical protein